MFEYSLNFTSNISYIDFYEIESPVDCHILKIIAVYCFLTMVLSIIFNTTLLWILIYYKDFRSAINSFMIALSICNLLGTFSELPLVIMSNLSCRWIFKKTGCVLGGFMMYFIGCTSIYLMAAISFERFYIIYKPFNIKSLNYKFSIIVIIICAFVGLFWSAMPIFGWSYYSLEGALTSCSVEWNERSFNVISYNITIFTVVYAIPLLAIFISNIKLVILIREMPKFSSNSNQNKQVLKKIMIERELTISAIILISGFLISWTPYALVSMYSAFITTQKLNPLIGTIPAMFAKSSLVWSSGFYILTNKQIKNKLKKGLLNVNLTEINSVTGNNTKKSESIEIPNTNNGSS